MNGSRSRIRISGLPTKAVVGAILMALGVEAVGPLEVDVVLILVGGFLIAWGLWPRRPRDEEIARGSSMPPVADDPAIRSIPRDGRRDSMNIVLFALGMLAIPFIMLPDLRDLVLQTTPLRIAPVHWGAAAPLSGGDQVLIRTGSSPLDSGSVVWLGERFRGEHRELATVLALRGDSLDMCFAQGVHGAPPVVATSAVKSVEGVVVAIVGPRARWRKLP